MPSIPINPIIGGLNKKEQQHVNKFMLYSNTHSTSMMILPPANNDDVEFIGSNRLKMLADNYLHTQFINRNGEVRETCFTNFAIADMKMLENDDSEMMMANRETQKKPKLSFSIEALIGIK